MGAAASVSLTDDTKNVLNTEATKDLNAADVSIFSVNIINTKNRPIALNIGIVQVPPGTFRWHDIFQLVLQQHWFCLIKIIVVHSVN